jgi:hypothetical protein
VGDVQAALAGVTRAVAALAPIATDSGTAKVSTAKAGTVKIAGTARVGKKLTAKVAKWTKGTAYSYTWYVGSKALKSGHNKTLKLTKAMQGKKIKVKVTGTNEGLVSVTKNSKATKKVAKKK